MDERNEASARRHDVQSPSVTVLNGQKALVFGSGDGSIWALQPRTGVPIWQYNISIRGVNVSPVVVGDTIFAGQSEENISGTTMGAVACFNGASKGDITKTGTMWKMEEVDGGQELARFRRRSAVLL